MDSRGLGIGMAFVVLAAASYFSRESFWEEAWTGAKREDTRLIMIDAGHGGNDPGRVGVDGVLEKDLNLQLAKKLKTLLEQQDMEVMLVREEDRGLYDENASNKKVQDMKRRCELIMRKAFMGLRSFITVRRGKVKSWQRFCSRSLSAWLSRKIPGRPRQMTPTTC